MFDSESRLRQALHQPIYPINRHGRIPSLKTGQAPEGISASDLAGVRAAYEVGRYSARKKSTAVVVARNSGQGWGIRFDGRGYTVTADGNAYTWGLELRRYGIPGFEHDIAGKAIVTCDKSQVNYDWDATLREWFVNDKRGLEQGWTLHQAPSSQNGSALAETIVFDLNVRGDLLPQVATDGATIKFVDEQGHEVLNYNGLKSWDSEGLILPSRFEAATSSSFRVISSKAEILR